MAGRRLMFGQSLLKLERLSYRYPTSSTPALDDVSLEVSRGEFLLLAGRSASGKSTLLRACSGLIPHFHGGVLSGAISVAGQDVLTVGPGQLAQHVGYLAQEPETQVLSTTVAAEISLPLDLRETPPSDRARAVEEVALALAIPHLLERAVDTLSGGELQRVALAAALVTRPKLVLLDEPTSQLDPVAGDELIWLLRRLNSEWGVTIVLAEHRLERCLAAADRVLGFGDGRLRFDGAPNDFLAWAVDHDPALVTPAARLFEKLGMKPLPTGVREAKLALADAGFDWPKSETGAPSSNRLGAGQAGGRGQRKRRQDRGPAVLDIHDLWLERGESEERREVLRGIGLAVLQGERVALMGRNGAGKSTLLKVAADLLSPVRGEAKTPAGMALLSQNPADYLVRERIGDELPGASGAEALARVGLAGLEEADPRDLSGGQRQRLALAIAMAGRSQPGTAPGLIALDEPTRGLDAELKADLAEFARQLAESGSAVVIATHDVEFAAAFADRVILLGQGQVIADGPAPEILSGGWYFATEVARILDSPGMISVESAVARIGGNR